MKCLFFNPKKETATVTDDQPKVKSLYKAVKLLDFFTFESPERGIKELA